MTELLVMSNLNRAPDPPSRATHPPPRPGGTAAAGRGQVEGAQLTWAPHHWPAKRLLRLLGPPWMLRMLAPAEQARRPAPR